ncbi:hypothetical protein PF008_g25257 [Phytophthora fragariae]|uniref:Uncharacterized protein n=1 Tax=Phytophthora fragariae TaxID=53985 RepID=A0A6G0QLA4_9STRA|nr:hypothetical protein PF008_g25257 [Phytophthora fragariae]
MPKSWKDDFRIWKGQRKYIPYEDLKQSSEGKVRDLQAQERYTLAKGTPKTAATKNERALVAAGPEARERLLVHPVGQREVGHERHPRALEGRQHGAGQEAVGWGDLRVDSGLKAAHGHLDPLGPTSTPPSHGNSFNDTCSYCNRPRHAIRHCRSLQKDLRTRHMKAGTVLPANFVLKGNSKREYPKNKSKNKRNGNSAGGNYNGNRGKNRQQAGPCV